MAMFNSNWFGRDDGVLPCIAPARVKTRLAAIGIHDSQPPIAPEMVHATVWVIYASETGFAEHFAQDARQTLHDGDVAARLLSFDELDLDTLQAVDQALFLVSTCHDGDPPDMADNFPREHLRHPASLPQLRYGMLSLGDSYHDEFCGFGRRLHQWLRASGARAWFEPLEMDNEDEAAARRWHDHIVAVIQLCCHAGYPA